jgi:hypothetical protein
LDAAGTQAAAARPQPAVGTAGIAASTAEDHLSVFNLTGTAATATVSVPQPLTSLHLYPGRQVVTEWGTDVQVEIAGSAAAVLPPRFMLTAVTSAQVPAGVAVEVIDGQHVRISGPACVLRLRTPDGRQLAVRVGPGQPREVTLAGAVAYPLLDLALGRTTFPTNPLPPGMSDPAAAVDGDEHTAWTPGIDGRMVVDLGSAQALGRALVEWTDGGVSTLAVATSTDGITYVPAATIGAGDRSVPLTGMARYVALTAAGWRPGYGRLRRFSIDPAT